MILIFDLKDILTFDEVFVKYKQTVVAVGLSLVPIDVSVHCIAFHDSTYLGHRENLEHPLEHFQTQVTYDNVVVQVAARLSST